MGNAHANMGGTPEELEEIAAMLRKRIGEKGDQKAALERELLSVEEKLKRLRGTG